MPSLRDLQRGFSTATLFGDGAAIASLAVIAGDLDPQKRIEIYRNNILGNYRKILAATFPVVRRLVGGPFFDAATDQFVRGYPSHHGDVNGYGADYAEFLAFYPPARELNYLPDVARLEWAIDQANIAADAGPLDMTALGAVAPDALVELHFRLHPSARLIASPFPILRIWQVNQPGYDGDDHVDLGDGADQLLVIRGDRGVAIDRIGNGEHVFLIALASNATFGVAASRAAEAEPEFDLAAAMRRNVVNHALATFRAPAKQAHRGHA